MGKKLLIILGNGFSIDFLNHIKFDNKIDLVNLFRLGTEVPWPGSGFPGFLSFKHCPNLWNLGARPNMDAESAMALIEDIITCVNVFASKKIKLPIGQTSKPNDIYIYAYKELLQYLRHLFIFYNNQITEIPDEAATWPWFEFLKSVHESENYDQITLVTYNYDIWLERLLNKYEIPFDIECIGENEKQSKIRILKPHGSISFAHKNTLDKESYSITYDRELSDAAPEDFCVKYESLSDNYLVTAILPPAGESARFNHSWSKGIRESAKNAAKQLSKNDEILICGLSYWHVDRTELDELLVSCDPLINISMINPNPKRTINAVLTSVFNNYICHSNSKILREMIKCQKY